MTKKGRYTASQIVLTLDKVEFVCGKTSVGGPPLCLEVMSESPRIFLGRRDRDLLAGMHQPMVLTVHSGSWHIPQVKELSNILFVVFSYRFVFFCW